MSSRASNHSYKSESTPLPIEHYDLDKVNIFVHTDEATKKDSVVIIKRTIKSFI